MFYLRRLCKERSAFHLLPSELCRRGSAASTPPKCPAWRRNGQLLRVWRSASIPPCSSRLTYHSSSKPTTGKGQPCLAGASNHQQRGRAPELRRVLDDLPVCPKSWSLCHIDLQHQVGWQENLQQLTKECRLKIISPCWVEVVLTEGRFYEEWWIPWVR